MNEWVQNVQLQKYFAD